MATGIIGAALSFMGTEEAAYAKAQGYKYRAKVADNNANALQGQEQATVQKQDRRGRAIIGREVASYGGSGVDVSQGSPVDVLADSVRRFTLDKLTTKYNYDMQINAQRDNAANLRIGAKNAIKAGTFQAISNSFSAFMSMGSATHTPQGPSYAGNNVVPTASFSPSGGFQTSTGGYAASTFGDMPDYNGGFA